MTHPANECSLFLTKHLREMFCFIRFMALKAFPDLTMLLSSPQFFLSRRVQDPFGNFTPHFPGFVFQHSDFL